MNEFEPPTYAPPNPAARPGNGLGLASLICSITGFVGVAVGICCFPFLVAGLLCALGVILGLIGLRKEPRGLAIGGIITGAVGALLAIAVAVVLALVAAQAVKIGTTNDALRRAETAIEGAIGADGITPEAAAGQLLIDHLDDAWLNTLRYDRLADDAFEIISAGPDGRFDTADDLSSSDLFNLDDFGTP
jgi:hypothetical protein